MFRIISALLGGNIHKSVKSNFCEYFQAKSQISRHPSNSFIGEVIYKPLDKHMSQPLANPFIKIKQQPEATVAETECPRCQQTGQTTILLSSIPLFREILICSFSCPHCGESNNEVQFAGRLPDLGVEILFRCLTPADLNRDIIRSEHCSIEIQELQLTLPPANRAEVTTIQSILLRAHQDLAQTLKSNTLEEEAQAKLLHFLDNLRVYSQGNRFPVTFKLRDPSGNSNIKNPFAPKIDKNMEVRYFKRTKEELIAMGYNVGNVEEEMKHEEQRQFNGDKLNFVKPFEEDDFMSHQPVKFEVDCEVCFMPGQLTSCRTSVPYFTDFIIMSFTCDHCGHHSTETKNSSQIGKQALVLTLNVEDEKDLKRDLFKSETCYVEIPEVELELDYGTLGGVLTTVEGLIEKIHDHLGGNNPFIDSDKEFGDKMKHLLDTLMEMRNGQRKFTLRLVDPICQSFLQNPYAPQEDRNVVKFLRDRTYEQDEMLGFNDMKVEGYQV